MSDETRRLIADRLNHAVAEMPGRAVPPANWHLTMRFLGEVGEVQFDRVVYQLGEAELGDPFDIRFGNLGAFPRPRRATVLWIGIEEGVEPLTRLAGQVEAAVEAAGFAPEERPFRAHLTLSRIRPQQDVSELVYDSGRFDARERVDAVTLFRSHLGRGGARYEILDQFPLTADG